MPKQGQDGARFAFRKGIDMDAELHHRMLFRLGQIVATPGALELLDRAKSSGLEYVLRHVTGDFGSVCAEDREANSAAIVHGTRVLSAYEVQGERLWVVTEADRSITTIQLPGDY